MKSCMLDAKMKFIVGGRNFRARQGSGHPATAHRRRKLLKIVLFNRTKEHFWGLIALLLLN